MTVVGSLASTQEAGHTRQNNFNPHRQPIMKFKTLFILIFAMLMMIPAVAQTYDSAANEAEGASYIRYTGSAAITTTESTYTQAMAIGDANQSIGVVKLRLPDVSGTEDVNVFVEFSNDLQNWTSISTAVYDALSTTAIYDSLDTVGGAALLEYKGSTWMRLHFDGQTGNPTNTLYWDVFLPKNTAAPLSGAANTVNRRS